MSQAVEVSTKEDVVTVRLNRPEAHNAVNEAMIEGLEKALEGLARKPEIRFLILTGEGKESFCAGGDLKYFATLKSRAQGLRAARRVCSILDRLAAGPQVVIAAVNGRALGGGCEILTACHFRFAVSTASFSYRQAANGLTTGWGGGVRLFELVGRAQALRLLLTAEPISANEALRIGFVDRVVSLRQLHPAILQWIETIRMNSPAAVRAFLEIANLANREGKAARARELEIFGERWNSTDFRRSLSAFLKARSSRP